MISEAYLFLAKVFLKTQMKTLSSHYDENHIIKLLKRTTLSFELIYNLSVKELTVLQKYLNTNLKNRFIQSSQSSVKVSVFFALKSDEDLQLCINYQKLNAITQKN